ncbi:hypothetical protein DYB30_008072 [Aphanomyces astaci]|uniref:Timeless N-terminal domain-containing protein n=1 Tax=Aphanomyces astaci TaxID=112090 RepID=A0A397F9K3_APHAT|nr:hypothetical protein DYB30_008072 [Aphanomyces astaci]RHY73268.1 hypothetical protein DYB38_000760 [Aphanomyces astaci]RHY75368.1 hypothetical protein DYB34_008721 [Aphanomyces astaci]RHZ20126.1 hypothetical protein DYB31_006677 [Aphanomyces astaci]RHZ20128.1 hypothetical protein DYB31_006674 [Aphanomyces astaci]
MYRSLVFSILKVLVMLTMKPTNESDNIAIQLSYLRGYKHAFLQHGVIQVLMAILVEPLSREGSSRTSQDYLNMELVLTLFRNLLAIPNADSRVLTSSTNYLSRLQEDLICILHDENVFDMLLLFAEVRVHVPQAAVMRPPLGGGVEVYFRFILQCCCT